MAAWAIDAFVALGGAMDAVPLSDGEPAGPQPLTEDEVARYVVTAAVWAPSVHNTQPWRFTARGQQISLCADDERQLRVADPDGREMMISCGAALFTARLALRSLGYLPETCLLPDLGEPLLVARVSWQRRVACTEFEQQLFGQVRQRRTHRGGFDLVPLPPGLLTALRQGAARYGAMLRVVADDGRRAALAAAVETAEHAQQFESERVRELARWAPAPDSAGSGLSRQGLRPRPRLGPAATQHGAAVQVRRGRRAAHHGARPPGRLDQCRAGPAADPAHREHLRDRSRAAHPAA
jgi:hypothetical protein